MRERGEGEKKEVVVSRRSGPHPVSAAAPERHLRAPPGPPPADDAARNASPGRGWAVSGPGRDRAGRVSRRTCPNPPSTGAAPACALMFDMAILGATAAASTSVVPTNGWRPCSREKSITPRPQQSSAGPSTVSGEKASGGRCSRGPPPSQREAGEKRSPGARTCAASKWPTNTWRRGRPTVKAIEEEEGVDGCGHQLYQPAIRPPTLSRQPVSARYTL